MNSWDDALHTLLAYGLTAAVAGVIAVGVSRKRGSLLPLPRLRRGSWSGGAAIFQFILLNFCALTAAVVINSAGLAERLLSPDADPLRKSSLISALAVLLFLPLSFHALAYFSGAWPTTVGLTNARWRSNAFLGSLAYLLAAPIILAVYAAVRPIFPGENPFEQMFRNGASPFEWGLFFVQVVVLAPVAEEWMFRGVLQGWLRRTNLLGHAVFLWTVVMWAAMRSFLFVDPGSGVATFTFTAILATLYAVAVALLYRRVLTRGLAVFAKPDAAPPPAGAPDLWTANLFEAEGEENRVTPWSDFGPAWRNWKMANGQLAIVGSALVFAAAHPWPTPIPLFLFGLVAGWLAFRTQSLVPSMVMHSLFNLASFIVLTLSVHAGTIGRDSKETSAPPGSASVAPAEPAPR